MRNSILILFSILFILSSCNKENIPTCEDCNFTCLEEIDVDIDIEYELVEE